jgi:hypothetical protein
MAALADAERAEPAWRNTEALRQRNAAVPELTRRAGASP